MRCCFDGGFFFIKNLKTGKGWAMMWERVYDIRDASKP